MPGFAAVHPMKRLNIPIVNVIKISITKNSTTRPEKIKSPQTLSTASPKKSETVKHIAYGKIRPIKSNGLPPKIVGSYCFVSLRRGIIPIVANVKNIAPKKNKNPSVCALDVEPAGLKSTLSFNVKPPLDEPLENCAFSIAIKVGNADLMSALCAVLVLS